MNEIRKELLQSIKEYFEGEQWTTLEDKVENDKDDTYHAHCFVETTLHPLTFCEVLKAYYRTRGMEIDRPIDLQPSNVGHNMLHGIHPTGTFHYDIAWRYKPGKIINPMPLEYIKERNNLQMWGKKEINEFFSKFNFIQPEGQAKEDLEQYFKSGTWKQTCEYVLDSTIAHFHANVETSVHPDALRDAALEAIKRQGWTIQKALHCIFSPVKGWIAGKVVFLLDQPRVMFDIAWKFNNDVSIRASTVPFMNVNPDVTEFDVRRKETIEYYTDEGEFITLSNEEIRKLEDMFNDITYGFERRFL